MTSYGKFITFEGGEGCGKSTQVKRLNALLNDIGIEHFITREPGGTPLAEKIRDLVVTGKADKMDPLTEYLLFSAARRDHIEKVIKPKLQKGIWVISDRFYDSSIVYQGFAQTQNAKVNHDFMERVYHEIAGSDFLPDVTFLLDLDPQVGLERALREHGAESRFEKKGIPFHQKVRKAFLKTAAQYEARFVIIDASETLEQVSQKIHAHVLSFIEE